MAMRRILANPRPVAALSESTPVGKARPPEYHPIQILLRLPAAAAPTAAPPAPASAQQPDDKQQHDRADRCVDDRGDDSGAEMDAEAREQPVADESTHDADEDIADDAEAGPLDDLACQPPRNE